jgi:hypothetical protein
MRSVAETALQRRFQKSIFMLGLSLLQIERNGKPTAASAVILRSIATKDLRLLFSDTHAAVRWHQ